MEAIDSVIDTLTELKNDSSLPKNIRIKVEDTINILKEENQDISLKINKALNSLDELTDENNLEPFVRTQIWNIVSMLEMIASQNS